MRRFFLLVGILAGLSLTITAPCRGEESNRRVRLDVKTKFADKTDLAAAKLGTILAFKSSTWATVAEYDEDYSVWLNEYDRRRRGNRYEVTLLIELRFPAMFRSGDLYRNQKIKISFRADEATHGACFFEDSLPACFVEMVPEEMVTEACVVGNEVEKVLWSLLPNRGVSYY